MQVPKKRIKHQYTSELELKSLLIRVQNMQNDMGETNYNNRINKYIIWHTAINKKKYKNPAKRNKVKEKVKRKIVRLSELTKADAKSYERFGEIILLMIKNILTKPNFSGYTYKDSFYGDTVYKILKYMHNFDHTKISAITGTYVNAFSYISQIIFNSVIYIIGENKKETERQRKYITAQQIAHQAEIGEIGWGNQAQECTGHGKTIITKMFTLDELEPDTLISRIDDILLDNENTHKFEITYPLDYEPTFLEYDEIKKLSTKDIKVIRGEDA